MANWSEYVQGRPVSTAPEPRPAPVKFRLPGWITDWESWLTFGLVLMVFLSVAQNIDSARWVPRMPSLTGISFLALFTGLLLARVRVPEVILHLFALAIGALVVFWLTLNFIDEPTLRESVSAFGSRWQAWIGVVRRGEPTTDNMPFVMLVLALGWIAAYLSSWSIFRWRNAWLALIPGGIALLTNISYLPSQFSASFVFFLFGAMLLVMRVFMLNRLHEWKQSDTPYPEFLSLNLLNVTFWVALIAIFVAWTFPQANEIGPLSRGWERLTAPVTEGSDRFSGLFYSIDSKKEVPLHNFGDTLPLQGRVVLGSRISGQVEFAEGSSNQNRPLRVKVYDEYTPGGWKAGPRDETELGPLEQVAATGAQKGAYKDRVEVTTNFVIESGFPKNALPTIGQPSQVSVNSKADIISTELVPDVDNVRARNRFKLGDPFVTSGTISTATQERLRTSGDAYPQYVRDRYLQLPAALPQRVRQLGTDLTKDRPTSYDKAKAIEEYLRTFPATFDVRTVPPGRDAVDFFLFDERKGYFDYQASAMVVLLRAAGVPARLAVGYQVDEFDQTVRRYLLRDKHAYAWPEVFFAGYGWIEFSPYGDAQQITILPGDSGGDNAAGGGDIIPELPGIDEFGPIEDLGGGSSTPFTAPESNPFAVLLPVLYVLMALVILAAIAGISLRVAWERGMAGLDYPAQLWEKTIRLATWLRLGPKPDQTPTEYSRRLQRLLPDATEGVDVVADSYLKSRYGRRDLTASEREELDSAWSPLRNRLIKRVLRWK